MVGKKAGTYKVRKELSHCSLRSPPETEPTSLTLRMQILVPFSFANHKQQIPKHNHDDKACDDYVISEELQVFH